MTITVSKLNRTVSQYISVGNVIALGCLIVFVFECLSLRRRTQFSITPGLICQVRRSQGRATYAVLQTEQTKTFNVMTGKVTIKMVCRNQMYSRAVFLRTSGQKRSPWLACAAGGEKLLGITKMLMCMVVGCMLISGFPSGGHPSSRDPQVVALAQAEPLADLDDPSATHSIRSIAH
jgi:hypothetical protein